MFTMIEKITALVSAILIAVSAAGCSNNSGTADTSQASQTSSGAASVTAEAAAEKSVSLSNPNATKEAQALFDYICETYRNGIISGQQESTWMGSDQYEFDYIYEKTGKYPAIRGLDYMNDDFNGVNKRAADWYERGGIVTICWHCGCDFGGSWDECMKTEISDWDAALTEGTPEYEKLIKGMDKGAEALSKLKDQNIPVLWRPFHELDGGWFWWSKGGAENFKKLWTIMYDRYTNYWKLDNLIWVFGYSGNGRDYDKWFPGNEYVDIIGADSYTDGANADLYKKVVAVAGEEVPICFHECGRIPTSQQLKDGKADWVWFMTWHTEHITDHNDTAVLKEIYNDEYVITLDELPKWK
ncbi:MAG: mannan endo-1,4-beta-mannosidase A and B [Ruminococcus sp.]|nr:mannan endo-1,4-beta-mannosidase A and B [Ruminococcus sp.]